MFDSFTADARRGVVLAEFTAGIEGATHTEPRHLVLGMLMCEPAIALVGEPADRLRERLSRSTSIGRTGGRVLFDPLTREALQAAVELSDRLAHGGTTSIHVLLSALMVDEPELRRTIQDLGIDIPQLLEVARELPPIPSDASTSALLRRYVESQRKGTPERHRFEDQLVVALLAEPDVRAAQAAAAAHAAMGNPTSAKQLVFIGALTGDTELVITNASAVLEARDSDPASFRADYGLALAHRGRFDDSRLELAAAREAAEGTDLDAVQLVAAECELLAGRADVAIKLLARVAEPDALALPLTYMYWQRLRLDAGQAVGEIPDVGPLPPAGHPPVADVAVRLELEAAILRAGSRRPRAAVRRLTEILEEAATLGLIGMAASARVARGQLLRRRNKSGWRDDLEAAAADLQSLGRVVLAEKVRRQLSSNQG